MAFLLICFHFAAQVFSETLPALPQDVLFDNWQVTWTSASEESTVTYTVRKPAPVITKTVKTWSDGASQQLQDCFDRTNWGIFEHRDLNVFTDSVLCYIKHCTDTVTVDKPIRIYPNQKPWMTREVHWLLEERDTALSLRSEDEALYSTARANLRRGIIEAQLAYKRRIEDHLDSNNSQQVWQGVQHLTNYRTTIGAAEGDASLAEDLNTFFARFESEPPEAATSHPTVRSSFTLILKEHELRHTMWTINSSKAAGPDGVTGRVLKDCADQLAGVFTRSSTSPLPSPPSHPV
ncbi:interferon gamma receptor 2 isoform X2 [Syngnathus typhle]|uniref:interferon gamma receptor 2 isoform X2 n=1 Tax=Syngnathus typhle TaxID=161592 RepID=UPI002A6B0C62|nr:interferon gamma receptor 2 isoform X2 [Syngnathus typhle]